jgi:hypothetical protein
MGRTDGNRITFFAPEAGKSLADYWGKLVPVHITSVRSFSLTGEIFDYSRCAEAVSSD